MRDLDQVYHNREAKMLNKETLEIETPITTRGFRKRRYE